MRAARQVHSTVLLGTLAPALDLLHIRSTHLYLTAFPVSYTIILAQQVIRVSSWLRRIE